MPRVKEFILTPELAENLCDHLAAGKSLASWAKLPGNPSAGLVCKWLAEPENAWFRESYARAREVQADTIFDEILDISDESSRDYREGPRGPEFDAEHVQRARLRIDARKWMAGKLRPKVYGEKQVLEGGDTPVEVRVTWQSSES